MLNDELLRKLRKVLALTTSPEEGEAQMAARILGRMLKEHNLSVADLEDKGVARPEINESGVDLGKANFKWKLSLAGVLAEHYYCHALISWTDKRFTFVGRPDNVESLKMLYAWLVDQIKAIATTERRNHFIRTDEHIDPLRWQINFGQGAVDRLDERLKEDRRMEQDKAGTALAVHHKSEVSDYLEKKHGYRIDGAKTKMERDEEERHNRVMAELERLKATDIEAYYKRCPWERPETEEEQAARLARHDKEHAAWRKRVERNDARRRGRYERPESEAKRRARLEGQRANDAGFSAADKVNLKPFITADDTKVSGALPGPKKSKRKES